MQFFSPNLVMGFVNHQIWWQISWPFWWIFFRNKTNGKYCANSFTKFSDDFWESPNLVIKILRADSTLSPSLPPPKQRLARVFGAKYKYCVRGNQRHFQIGKRKSMKSKIAKDCQDSLHYTQYPKKNGHISKRIFLGWGGGGGLEMVERVICLATLAQQ